ncbi:MAG TPA: MmcQ/YjbR family DNA-binding protein [Actinocrinis sp.]|nr:MmcQ/YjbR family DNA-binding protein [Actinocrinis sp.]
MAVTAQDVRTIALTLPRAYEALVRDRVKFRVKQIVFVSLSQDETVLGFGYPKEEREALVASDPEKFLMPVESDLRFNWVRARMDKIDPAELDELVVDAWRMTVPKKVWNEYLAGLADRTGPAETAGESEPEAEAEPDKPST